MEEMTCEKHDELASRTQFITHTIGRVLGAMDLQVPQKKKKKVIIIINIDNSIMRLQQWSGNALPPVASLEGRRPAHLQCKAWPALSHPSQHRRNNKTR